MAPRKLSDLNNMFERVVGFIIPLLGISLFVMLIIGGFKFITSGGDPKAVEEAKKTITWAVGGLVLASLAYFILILIYKFTGQASILQFNIFKP